MKTIHLLLALCAGLFLSCSENCDDPRFAGDELFIYYSSWADATTLRAGSTYAKRDVVVSPADGSVSCCWKLDGREIARGLAVEHLFADPGVYRLTFEAVRGETVNTRTTTVTVE